MVLYQVFKLSNSPDITKIAPKKERIVKHPKIPDFKIKWENNQIVGSGKEIVNSILSTENNPVPAPINIDFLIKQYKIRYCLVKLSGQGLLAVHGYPKYVKDNILHYLNQFFNEEYSVDLEFISPKYTNEHFKTDFWGEKITCQLVYNQTEKMYIKISSQNFLKIIEENRVLKDYFTNGTIKFMRGELEELESKTNKIIKFDNYGVFKCEVEEIESFNNFIEHLIDKGFFGGIR
jgi:hypothetical protein